MLKMMIRTTLLTLTLSTLSAGCGSGKSAPKPGTPPDPCSIDAPVCGMDDAEYANACAAETAGVETKWDGPCGCGLDLDDPATKSDIVGAWTGYKQWPIQLMLDNAGGIVRYDWVSGCAFATGCDNAQYAVSQGKWSLSGPLIHLTWTKPAPNPAVQLPTVLLWEPSCPDGKPYLAELEPKETFYGKAD